MKPITPLFGIVYLSLAICFGQEGSSPTAHSSSAGVSQHWPPAVRTLTDTNYDDVTLKTDGLAMVWFYKSGTTVKETTLLNALGEQTNRFKFFRVSRDENPQLWQRFLSRQFRGKLGTYRSFIDDRGDVSNPVVVLLLFYGKVLGEVPPIEQITPWDIEKILVDWVSQDGDRLSQRFQGKTVDVTPIISDKEIIPFFCEALEQMRMPRNLGYRYEYYFGGVWRCLEQFKPVEQLEPLVPFLTAHLGGEYTLKACRILARIGDKAVPAVDSLMGMIEQVVKQVDAQPKVANAQWDRRWESLHRATAAAHALGGIGPKASKAVPLLTRIAESEYQRMAFPQEQSDRIGEPKYGWDGSLGLQSAIALNRIVPPPAPGKNAANYSGSTLRVFSQGHEDAPVATVSIVFWKGRHCFETQSDRNGNYSINLPPGRYLSQNGHGLPSSRRDFEMGNNQPEIIEVAAKSQIKKNIVADMICVDYGHNAAYEVRLPGETNAGPALLMSSNNLNRIAAVICDTGKRLGYKLRVVDVRIKPYIWRIDEAASIELIRAKKGKAVLSISAFGPKWAADKAQAFDKAFKNYCDQNQNLLLTPVSPNRQSKDELAEHRVRYTIQLVETNMANGEVARGTNPVNYVNSILQATFLSHGLRPKAASKWDPTKDRPELKEVIAYMDKKFPVKPIEWERYEMGHWITIRIRPRYDNGKKDETEIVLRSDGFEAAALGEQIDAEIGEVLNRNVGLRFKRDQRLSPFD